MNSMGTEELNAFADNIEALSNHVKALGPDFYFFVPNAKEIIYPEEYAVGVNLAKEHDLDGLEKIMESRNSDVKFISCTDKMMDHKDEYIYYKDCDTVHWDSLGAFYGYE